MNDKDSAPSGAEGVVGQPRVLKCERREEAGAFSQTASARQRRWRSGTCCSTLHAGRATSVPLGM